MPNSLNTYSAAEEDECYMEDIEYLASICRPRIHRKDAEIFNKLNTNLMEGKNKVTASDEIEEEAISIPAHTFSFNKKLNQFSIGSTARLIDDILSNNDFASQQY